MVRARSNHTVENAFGQVERILALLQRTVAEVVGTPLIID